MDPLAHAEDVAAVGRVPQGCGVAEVGLVCQEHGEGEVLGLRRFVEDAQWVVDVVSLGAFHRRFSLCVLDLFEVAVAFVRHRVRGHLGYRSVCPCIGCLAICSFRAVGVGVYPGCGMGADARL